MAAAMNIVAVNMDVLVVYGALWVSAQEWYTWVKHFLIF